MNINEKLQWEDNVKLLTRQEKVEGGSAGAANVQAVQLANRTRWLKAQIESVKDGREHTFYISESDPDGTLAGIAGTREGDLFRVSLGPDSEGAFTYYWNLNGQAVKDATLPSAAAVENLIPLNRQAKYLVAEQGAGSFP
ncbi:SGNH/GDSL hydrolase family protein, partial [Klebsiella pneumoniae]